MHGLVTAQSGVSLQVHPTRDNMVEMEKINLQGGLKNVATDIKSICNAQVPRWMNVKS